MECAPYIKVWRDIRHEPCLRRQTRQDGGATGWMFISAMLLANECDFEGNKNRGLLVKDGVALNLDDLADAAGQKDEVAEKSITVLLGWGWITQGTDRSYFIPKYERRQESLEAKRQREFRDRKRNESGTTGVTSNVTNNADRNGDVTGMSRDSRARCPGPGPALGLDPDLGLGLGHGWEEQKISYPTGTLAPSPRKTRTPKPDKFRLDLESWEWVNLDNALRTAWAMDYPGINLDDELRKARAWVRADPTKRRKSNWGKFVAGWFSRAQDRCGSSAREYPSLKGKAENEWQSVLEAAKTGSDIAMGIVEGNIHERTRYALRQFDRNPIQAMKEIGMVRQDNQLEIKHRQFIAAWVAFEDKAE